MTYVCDDCLTAIWDEHHIEDRQFQIGLAVDTGAEMADHNCCDRESCECGCNNSHRRSGIYGLQ